MPEVDFFDEESQRWMCSIKAEPDDMIGDDNVEFEIPFSGYEEN